MPKNNFKWRSCCYEHYLNVLFWEGLFTQNKGKEWVFKLLIHYIWVFKKKELSLSSCWSLVWFYIPINGKMVKTHLCLAYTRPFNSQGLWGAGWQTGAFSDHKQKPLSHARLPLKLPSSVLNFLEGWWFLSSEHLSSGRAVQRRGGTVRGSEWLSSPSAIPPGRPALNCESRGISLLWGFIQLWTQCCLIFLENHPFSIVQKELKNAGAAHLKIRGELTYYSNCKWGSYATQSYIFKAESRIL